MQIMPETAKALGIDPTDPVQSIYGAARVLRENLDRYGNLPDALRAYNAGTDQKKWGNPETMAYPQKVAEQYAGLQMRGDDPFAGPGIDAPARIASPDAKSSGPNAFDDMFGASGNSPKTSEHADSDPFNSVFGHEVDAHLPMKAHAHQGSWVGNLAQFGNDTINAAGREIDRPLIKIVSAIPGVSGALAGTHWSPEQWRADDAAQERQQSGDWGASVSQPAGALLGDAAVGAAVGRLMPGAVPSGTLALAGRRAVEGAVAAGLVDQNPLLGAAGGAASVPVGKITSRAANRLIGRNAPASDQSHASSGPEAEDSASATGAGAGPGAEQEATGAPSGSDTRDGATAAAAGNNPTPDAVKLGLFTSPKQADKLANRVWADMQSGGPVSLVQSSIPGVHLTASQATGNPGLAQLERLRRAANPAPFVALEQQNAAARNAFAQQIIGTEEQLQAAEAARSVIEAQHRDAAFGNQAPVDVLPIRQHLARLIDDNRGRETVQQPLSNVMRQLVSVTNDDGTAMPEHLWNVRKYLGDMVSPRARGTANDGQAAASQLLDLKPTITDTIEQGAPGFKAYAKSYEELSRPIDAMRFLQSRNLTNAQGDVQLGRLDSFIKSIRNEKGKPGYREADSVTPEQFKALENLRDDMRLASRIDLGKARGSDTNVNLLTTSRVAKMAQGVAPKLAAMTGGSLGAAIAGGPLAAPVGGWVGNALAGAVDRRIAGRLANTEAATLQAIDNRLLNPYARK